MIYWFRADLLKGKDPDLNFTTYSSQLPQICPLFNFLKLSFSWVHLLSHVLGFIRYPISLGFICCPIPPAYQYPASLGNWAKFCLPCICPLSHFPKFPRFDWLSYFWPKFINYPFSSEQLGQQILIHSSSFRENLGILCRLCMKISSIFLLIFVRPNMWNLKSASWCFQDHIFHL